MSNNERILAIIQSPFGENIEGLRLIQMSGADYLSSPFHFTLTTQLSDTKLQWQDLLGKPISFRIGTLAGEYNIYHALIYSANEGHTTAEGQQTLELLVQPWFRFLADKIDSRVFSVEKPLSIPEIVSIVFKNNGYFDYRFELNKTYQPLTICVQHNESDYNFVSRLLEQAGIYYYFTHTETAHTMVLTDAPYPTMAKPVPAKFASETHTEAHISHWRSVASPSVSSMNAQRFDFKQPQALINAQHKTTLKNSGLPNSLIANQFHYNELPTDATETQLSTMLQQKMTATETSGRYVSAQGYYPNWQAGTVFSLQHHDIGQHAADYYIYAIAHCAQDYSGLPSHTDKQHAQHYQNEFRAYKTSQVFVPLAAYPNNRDSQTPFTLLAQSDQQPITSQPNIPGLHSATVVGPKDTPIYTDKYGRVKVQFDWDIHSNNNENSFAWVRMKQSWGSDQFGAHFTPRVGQEVLVSFDHGDPNKPVIIGVTPNDSSKPPFAPNKTPTQLGFRSLSLAKDAMHQPISGHQLLFDDDSSQAQVHLHSYKDLQQTAANNYTLNVQGKTNTAIAKGDSLQTSGGKVIINAKKAVHIVNGTSRISITPTDITLDASKISLGSGSGSTVHINNTAKPANDSLLTEIGKVDAHSYQFQEQVNEAITNTIKHHPIEAIGAISVVGDVDDALVIASKDELEDVAGDIAKNKLPLPKNPDELVSKHGYEETSHPRAFKKGHRTFKNLKSKDELRFDEGKDNGVGFEKIDHYHRLNPTSTSSKDFYLDKNGNPVSRGNAASHIFPEDN